MVDAEADRIDDAGVFQLAIVAFAVGLFGGLSHGYYAGEFPAWAVPPVLVGGGLLAATYLHWATHPGGIKDSWSGGSVSSRRRSGRLDWDDWALGFTHRGFVDGRANLVRVETRVLLGLLPVRRVLKSTREFRHVRLDEQLQTRSESRRGVGGFSQSTEKPDHLTLTLLLANGSGETLTLLNLNTPLGRSAERDFMRELKLDIESLISGTSADARD